MEQAKEKTRKILNILLISLISIVFIFTFIFYLLPLNENVCFRDGNVNSSTNLFNVDKIKADSFL